MEDICEKINNLYKNICFNDFFVQGKDDYLNVDIEDAVYINITTDNIYNILSCNLLENLDQNSIISILASNDGRMIYALLLMYNFKKLIAVENIYEFYYLSRKLVKPNIENKDVRILNESLLASKLYDKDLIIINYNNSNSDFNNMLENKVINEAKSGSIVIKIAVPFKQNVALKLLKIKTIINNGSKLLVFYYKKD